MTGDPLLQGLSTTKKPKAAPKAKPKAKASKSTKSTKNFSTTHDMVRYLAKAGAGPKVKAAPHKASKSSAVEGLYGTTKDAASSAHHTAAMKRYNDAKSAAKEPSIYDMINGLVDGTGGGFGAAPSLGSYTQPFDNASQRVDDYSARAKTDIAAENAALRSRLAILQQNATANLAQTTAQAQGVAQQAQQNVSSQTDPIMQQLQGQGVNTQTTQAQVGAAQAGLASQAQNTQAFQDRAAQGQQQDFANQQATAGDIQSSANSTLNANAAGLHGQIDSQRAGAERQYTQDSQQYAQQQSAFDANQLQTKLSLLGQLQPLLGASPGADVRQSYAGHPEFGQIFDAIDTSPTAAVTIRNQLADKTSDLRTQLSASGIDYKLVTRAINEYEKTLKKSKTGKGGTDQAASLYKFLSGK